MPRSDGGGVVNQPVTREEATEAFEDMLRAQFLKDEPKYVASLSALHTARQEESAHKRTNTRLSDALKEWFRLAGREDLIDGELGIAAWVTVDGNGYQYDLKAMSQTPAGQAAILEAARLGWLSCDDASVTKDRAGVGSNASDVLWRNRAPKPGRVVLHVDSIEKYEATR